MYENIEGSDYRQNYPAHSTDFWLLYWFKLSQGEHKLLWEKVSRFLAIFVKQSTTIPAKSTSIEICESLFQVKCNAPRDAIPLARQHKSSFLCGTLGHAGLKKKDV